MYIVIITTFENNIFYLSQDGEYIDGIDDKCLFNEIPTSKEVINLIGLTYWDYVKKVEIYNFENAELVKEFKGGF